MSSEEQKCPSKGMLDDSIYGGFLDDCSKQVRGTTKSKSTCTKTREEAEIHLSLIYLFSSQLEINERKMLTRERKRNLIKFIHMKYKSTTGTHTCIKKASKRVHL